MAGQLIQVRRGTAAQAATANPILASGEIGFETDSGKFKIGNGSTAWNSLLFPPSAGVSIVDSGNYFSSITVEGALQELGALTLPATVAEFVRDTMGTAIVAGSNMSVVVSDGGDTITLSATSPAVYTDENARDAIGAALVGETNYLDVTPNDVGDQINLAISSVLKGRLTALEVKSLVGAQVHGTGTINNTTTISDVASHAADAAMPMGLNDSLVYVCAFTLGNTSGADATFNFQFKVAGQNWFNVPVMTIPSVAGGGRMGLFTAEVVTALADGSAQDSTAEFVLGANSTVSDSGTINMQSMDSVNRYIASHFKTTLATYTTQPLVQFRVTLGTAATTIWVRRMFSRLIRVAA